MKRKIIFVLSSCLIALSSNAQFRIHSNGNLSFKSSSTPLSPMSLNCGGNQDYFITYSGNRRSFLVQSSGQRIGANIQATPPLDNTTSQALRVISQPFSAQNPSSMSIGVWSSVDGGPYAYGVVGTVTPATAGVGIVGSANQYVPAVSLIDHSYAGFFLGDVKVTGSLNVSGVINGTIAGMASSSGNNDGIETQELSRECATSDLLSQLSANTLRYANKKADSSVEIQDTAGVIQKLPQNKMEQQSIEKKHYVLDAAQMENMFPDLVYVKEDGTKVINYMEMIPLLVQSIGELKEELSALKSGKEDDIKKVPAISNYVSSSFTEASLKQNTPNPFSSQTQIRFTLPDNTRNAYIYIFDMNGKMQKQIAVDSSMDSVTINGYELSAGIYLYSLVVNGQEIDTKRMILSK